MSHSIFGLKYNLNQMPKLTSLAAVLNLAFTRCSGEIDPEIIEKKQQSKRRRRWFQLGLRTLLILVTLASATIGWVVVELEQRRGEVPAIAWAEANLCYVDFSTRPKGTRNWWESTEDSLFGDSVRHFSCYSGRRGSSDLTELSPLAYFKNLKFLGIRGQS